MVHFSGKARKMNHILLFASEASNRLSNYLKDNLLSELIAMQKAFRLVRKVLLFLHVHRQNYL
ncbi:MAG: hypothetical protein U5L45_04905 [Saprospiraceae bacterium]|nr:hypothetical protein [Saprospiraceae bacterium]